MAGRTLLQQAAPITFGLKAAGWLLGLDGARADLAALRRTGLWLQFGGAVGTLAALGDAGLEVAAATAERLELTMPATPWHTNRVPAARLAGSLAAACGAMGKVARGRRAAGPDARSASFARAASGAGLRRCPRSATRSAPSP